MPKKGSETKSYAPIPSFATLTGFIETLNSTTVPPVIDSSLLGKMSGTTRSWLMSALRYLNLIDGNGSVQERLYKLVKAYGTQDWRQVLADELLEPYVDVIGDLNIDSGTQAQLYDAFRTRGNVDGQMLEKAVRFYLALLTEAGLTYSPHFKVRSIRKAAKKKKSTKKKNKGGQSKDDDDDALDPLNDIDDLDVVSWARFQIPIPGKGVAHIALPSDIDGADWEMVGMMLNAYVQRLTKD